MQSAKFFSPLKFFLLVTIVLCSFLNCFVSEIKTWESLFAFLVSYPQKFCVFMCSTILFVTCAHFFIDMRMIFSLLSFFFNTQTHFTFLISFAWTLFFLTRFRFSPWIKPFFLMINFSVVMTADQITEKEKKRCLRKIYFWERSLSFFVSIVAE